MSDSDQVKLKPVFGMEPGKYLTILYAIILAALIFLLLFLPGIVRPGSIYVIDCSPADAAVFVDGGYAGAAPCRVFIPAGEHELRIEKDYYAGYKTTITSGNRVFASMFAPKKQPYHAELMVDDIDGLLSGTFRDFAGWGMIDTYYENYQPEPLLGPMFHDLYNSDYTDTRKLSGFLYSIMPFVHNEELYRDFVDAVVWYERIRTEDDIDFPELDASYLELDFLKNSTEFYENLPFWFYSILAQDEQQEMDWYPAIQEEYGSFLRDFENDYPAAQAAVTVNGMRFIMLSGGKFLMGADGSSFPFPAASDDLLIMDREVTNELYGMFLMENGKWQPDNREQLIREGLVNGDYLRNYSSSAKTEPVNYISWYAADAFCSWLQTKLPDYLSDYTVRLPGEFEWEWAALTDANSSGIFRDSGLEGPAAITGRYPNSSGLYDMRGNLWEWCDNWYAPAAFLITSRDPAYNEAYQGSYDGIEKSVRGGSWANDKNIGISTRGSQPPEWCTDFLGFRPVMVRE